MDPQESFVAQLTANQNRLYAYILSLVADPTAAEDVLQTANLTLWREAENWDPATSFMAWAVTVARYEVMTWRKKASRDRLIFSEETLETIAQTNNTRGEDFELRQAALVECFNTIGQRFRDLLCQRYADNSPIASIAKQVRSTPNAVAQALHRARQALARCMQRKSAKEAPQ